MEQFLRTNVEQAIRRVGAADVLGVGFSLFPQRLLVDMRCTEDVPPMVGVVEPLASVEERIQELLKTRPQFPPPDRFFFFLWPRRIATFERLGVWQSIVQRCLDSGHARIAGDCNLALEQLYQLERRAVQDTIQGSNYHTLWERSK